MNRLQGVQRRLQSIFSLHRRKMAAKLVVSRYSKVKALAKASSYKFAVGYKYLAHKVATDESARMILAALLLVILISWVAMAVTKRRRRRRSQTKLQKEKLSEVDAAVKRPLLKSILKVRSKILLCLTFYLIQCLLRQTSLGLSVKIQTTLLPTFFLWILLLYSLNTGFKCFSGKTHCFFNSWSHHHHLCRHSFFLQRTNC